MLTKCKVSQAPKSSQKQLLEKNILLFTQFSYVYLTITKYFN